MGTNFYIRKGIMAEGLHIGKRSAAGMYCWDCHLTLCKDGEEEIHSGLSKWHDACPICGERPAEETLDNGAAGRELGFNKSTPKAKTGVASCCSFSWAMKPNAVERILGATPLKKKIVIDEYGRKYTPGEFADVLAECPVQFYDSIGGIFS